MSPHHRHSLISAAVLAAATKTRTNPAGGSWADPANWSAPVPPAYPDIAVFDLNAAPAGYTVTLPSSLSHIGTLAVRNDTLTLAPPRRQHQQLRHPHPRRHLRPDRHRHRRRARPQLRHARPHRLRHPRRLPRPLLLPRRRRRLRPPRRLRPRRVLHLRHPLPPPLSRRRRTH